MLRPEFEQLGSRHVELGKQRLEVGPQQEYYPQISELHTISSDTPAWVRAAVVLCGEST